MPYKEGGVLNWATDIDGKTLAQAQRSAQLPFVQPYVALMPDAHFGYGATVGSVIPTKGAIIPSAVGVDIGCGMIASRLNVKGSQLPDSLRATYNRIATTIPAGVGKGHDASHALDLPATAKDWGNGWVEVAEKQFGSLGSGNHFVEVCLDENEDVWIVLHSGSRGIGNKVANMHIDKAKGDMKKMFISLPDPDLAYLVEGTPAFNAYMTDMLWAQEYAMASRQAMMTNAVWALWKEFNFSDMQSFVAETINCHHNFTARENHNGQNVWITRKGAIRAREGDRGVIPGSMGTRSYIVSGLGNESSFCSCSHGAGRRLSRGEAKRTLDVETLHTQMKGITWSARQGDDLALLDEDPRAYKDIDTVMENQKDLVKIEHTLHQVLNYKGL